VPTLPSYDSSRNIKPQLSAPLRDEAAQMAANQNKITGTITAIAKQWSDANDTMQYTKFKTDTETAIAQQKAAAINDPNINNINAHLEALKKIKSQSTGAISNKQVESKAMLELDHSLAVAQIEIDASFKKKQLLTNELKLDEYVKTMAANRSNALTEAMRMQNDDEFQNTILENVANETITPAKGKKLINDYRLGGVDLDIMNDGATTKESSYVYEQLKKGEKGEYKDLSDAERADRLEKAELHIRRNKIMANYNTNLNQNIREKELLNNFGSPVITAGEVRNMLIAAEIRPEFGEKYTKKMFEIPPEKSDYNSYATIKMMQLNGFKEKDINKEVLNNIDKLSDQDRKSILQNKYDPRDEKTMTIKASAQALYQWAFRTLDEKADEVLYSFFQKLDTNPNIDIDSALKSTQQGFIRKYFPSTTMLKDTPNIIGDRNKLRSIYKKESKAGGKKVSVKPVSTVYQSMDMNFEDL